MGRVSFFKVANCVLKEGTTKELRMKNEKSIMNYEFESKIRNE
jgi:hypothetical protein